MSLEVEVETIVGKKLAPPGVPTGVCPGVCQGGQNVCQGGQNVCQGGQNVCQGGQNVCQGGQNVCQGGRSVKRMDGAQQNHLRLSHSAAHVSSWTPTWSTHQVFGHPGPIIGPLAGIIGPLTIITIIK